MMSYEKIANILRADKDTLRILEEKMNAATGKSGVFDKIVAENRALVDDRLAVLKLHSGSSAREVYEALISKVEADDINLYNVLGQPQSNSAQDWNRVLKEIKTLVGDQKGFFLKKEKAAEFLKNVPPKKVLEALGYKDVDDMILHEDLFELYSSLRFVEGSDWINSVFLKQYARLKPTDFEEREITTTALSEKWSSLAQGFVKKKYHNISHLKEMGLIYIIPADLDISGETLRNFSLIFHYYNEVVFYSNLMKKYAENETTFAKNVISLFRGDTIDYRQPFSYNARWMVIQRYLAKEDENDWRLFEPHINPEAMHWERAEGQIVQLSRKMDGSATDLSFWKGLNWAGDFFKTDIGTDVLVSFDLVDTSMALAQEKEMIKYLYHHQESLWNKIFAEYLGEDKMEDYMREYILSGSFEL